MRRVKLKEEIEIIRSLKRGRPRHSIDSPLAPLIRLWALRMLVLLGTGTKVILPGTNFAKALGLPEIDEDETVESAVRAVRASLRKMHQKAELASQTAKLPPVLRANVERLARLVGFDETSKSILVFILLLKSDAILLEASESLGSLSSLKAINALSVILGLPEQEVKMALSSSAPLFRSGLLRIDRDDDYVLRSKFNLLWEGFADTMISHETDPTELLRQAVRPGKPGTLQVSDYAHLGSSVAVLQAYLRTSLNARKPGVNILLHGKPGTGKSELARLMAREINCDLMEIVSEDEDGDPVDGKRRLSALRAAQCIFANRTTLILFDEIEDVFNDIDEGLGGRSTGQVRKGWVNQMLESNPVPCFWLTNSVGCLDDAFIRRFDMVLELSVPPRRQRRQIIAKAAEGLFDEATVDRLAATDSITPAIVTRAATVARSVREQLPNQQPATVMERLIRGTLGAQGIKSGLFAGVGSVPEIYDPTFINADSDLAALARGLAITKSGRICLYGPPGTGKTAYGHWMARELDRPLHVKRASDLLSMYVGEAEKNIAAAFSEAADEGAILLIDEVDSFLQDRRSAVRSWEVTQVNELLTQMESFAGIFIASTNLMGGMDQAALRRFDVKAKFDYLAVDQAWGLLCRHCAAQGISPPSNDDRSAISRLDLLTPGDFAVVARRQHFEPRVTASQWIAALAGECALKEAGKPRIGFIN